MAADEVVSTAADAAPKEYIKLTREDEVHHGVVYRDGLVKDPHKWNSQECAGGGLHVCERKDVGHWLTLYRDLKWFRRATIPPDAKVVVFQEKVKASALILSEREPIEALNLNILDVLTSHASAMHFFTSRDPELWALAIKIRPSSLQFAPFQTPELCLKAVRVQGMTLGYVRDEFRTPELCAAAVANDGKALFIVGEAAQRADPQLALTAVKQNGLALEFVYVGKTPELCLVAVKRTAAALKFVPDDLQTPEMVLAAVQGHGEALKSVAPRLRTHEVYMQAVKSYGLAIKYVPDISRTHDVFMRAVENDGLALEHVPAEKQTLDMCIAAVERDYYAIRFVAQPTVDVYIAAVKHSYYAWDYVPEEFKPAVVAAVPRKFTDYERRRYGPANDTA